MISAEKPKTFSIQSLPVLWRIALEGSIEGGRVVARGRPPRRPDGMRRGARPPARPDIPRRLPVAAARSRPWTVLRRRSGPENQAPPEQPVGVVRRDAERLQGAGRNGVRQGSFAVPVDQTQHRVRVSVWRLLLCGFRAHMTSRARHGPDRRQAAPRARA
jgi:hypothetical protein